jgi:predicted RNA-binding Zn ribbon-like protein
MSPAQPAPGELELVREFVNTHDVEEQTDTLSAPEALRDWAEGRGLDVGSRPLGQRDVEKAIELREALRALLLANGGEPLGRGAIETLNAVSAGLPLRLRFAGDGASALSPAGEGIEGALAAILAIVYRAMAEGTWPRLKACRADDCQWAFFDRSKNRSAHWCSMAVCGNRAKARGYRKRRKSELTS